MRSRPARRRHRPRSPASPRCRRCRRGHAQAVGAGPCGSRTSTTRWPHRVRRSGLDDSDGERLLDPAQPLSCACRLVSTVRIHPLLQPPPIRIPDHARRHGHWPAPHQRLLIDSRRAGAGVGGPRKEEELEQGGGGARREVGAAAATHAVDRGRWIGGAPAVNFQRSKIGEGKEKGRVGSTSWEGE
jgi:hypothetical protein